MAAPTDQKKQTPELSDCPQTKCQELTTHIIRLLPGMPLKQSLIDYCKEKGLTSAFIVTCVGSLTDVAIRMANSYTIKRCSGHYEIVSLVGTVSGGEGHIHISISDSEGHVIGGHLHGEDRVYTTAEVVLNDMGKVVAFQRENCPMSGWPELCFKSQ